MQTIDAYELRKKLFGTIDAYGTNLRRNFLELDNGLKTYSVSSHYKDKFTMWPI